MSFFTLRVLDSLKSEKRPGHVDSVGGVCVVWSHAKSRVDCCFSINEFLFATVLSGVWWIISISFESHYPRQHRAPIILRWHWSPIFQSNTSNSPRSHQESSPSWSGTALIVSPELWLPHHTLIMNKLCFPGNMGTNFLLCLNSSKFNHCSRGGGVPLEPLTWTTSSFWCCSWNCVSHLHFQSGFHSTEVLFPEVFRWRPPVKVCLQCVRQMSGNRRCRTDRWEGSGGAGECGGPHAQNLILSQRKNRTKRLQNLKNWLKTCWQKSVLNDTKNCQNLKVSCDLLRPRFFQLRAPKFATRFSLICIQCSKLAAKIRLKNF